MEAICRLNTAVWAMVGGIVGAAGCLLLRGSVFLRATFLLARKVGEMSNAQCAQGGLRFLDTNRSVEGEHLKKSILETPRGKTS